MDIQEMKMILKMRRIWRRDWWRGQRRKHNPKEWQLSIERQYYLNHLERQYKDPNKCEREIHSHLSFRETEVDCRFNNRNEMSPSQRSSLVENINNVINLLHTEQSWPHSTRLFMFLKLVEKTIGKNIQKTATPEIRHGLALRTGRHVGHVAVESEFYQVKGRP